MPSQHLPDLQRTLEELFIKGPIANTRDNPEYHVVGIVCWVWMGFGRAAGGGGAGREMEGMMGSTALPCPSCPPSRLQESLDEQREVLNAWHSWMLRELDLFKSKFRGAAATLLGAGDVRGFSLGAPHRRRLPRCIAFDQLGRIACPLCRMWAHHRVWLGGGPRRIWCGACFMPANAFAPARRL